MNDLIYGMIPVNATAAKVVNQSGCEDDPNMAQLDALRRAAKNLQQKLEADKSNTAARKEIAKKYYEIGKQISELKLKTGTGYKSGKDISGHFIDICRRDLSKYQFDKIMNEAIEKGKIK